MRKFPFKFDHTDHNGETHEVRGFVSEMDDAASYDLNQWVGDEARQNQTYNPSLARFYALRTCTEKLTIDNKTYSLTNSNKKVPRIKDEDTGLTVLDRVLGQVIYRNEFLLEEEQYKPAFEAYALDEEAVPESDPTELRTIG